MEQVETMTDSVRVLLIEDNPADAVALKRELWDIPAVRFDVVHEGTLADGLTQAEGQQFDVVLLDLGLPDSKRQETMRRVAKAAPDLPVVVLTVSDEDALVEEAINQGVQEYFVKGTVDERRLAWAIRYAIHRKQAEVALRDSERQLRSTFENEAVGIAHVDAEGRVIRVNQRLCSLIGYTREQLLQRTIHDVTFAPDLAEDLAKFERLMRGEHVTHAVEKRCVRGDGSLVWGRITRSLQRDDGGPPYSISFVEDITDRKQAEARLAQTTAELERSNRDLEQFAYVAGHDLQEPLRMVTGFMQLLQDRSAGQLDAKAQEYVRFAADGAARMSALIEGILAYGRVQSGPRQPVLTDLEKVVDSTVANLQASIDESHASITRDRLPTVNGDAVQLAQVLQNLLGNAIKFRAEGVSPEIHIGAVSDGTRWVFSVKDNGIGVAPQFKDRIFQIFQRLHTRREFDGAGIGLAVCKKIVERHGGRIWIESEPDKGTTFWFTLPAVMQ